VNVNNWNNINRNNIRNGRATQLPANGNRWRHDAGHRGGVAYRDAGTRQQYLGQRGNSSISARDFRGYGQGGAGLSQRGQGQLGSGGLGSNQRPGHTLGQGGGNRGQGSLQGGNRGQQRPGAGTNRGQQQYNAFGDLGGRGSTISRQSNRGAASRTGSAQRWGGSRGGGRRR